MNNIRNTVYLSYGDCTAIGNYVHIVMSMLNGISTPGENCRLSEIFGRLKQKGSSQAKRFVTKVIRIS